MSTVVPIAAEAAAAAPPPAPQGRPPVAADQQGDGGEGPRRRRTAQEQHWVPAASVWDNVASRIAERPTTCDAAGAVTRRRKLADAWLRVRGDVASTLALLRRDRATAAAVLLLFAAILALGTWAVYAGAEAQAAFVRKTASYVGEEALVLLEQELGAAAYPVLALALVRPHRPPPRPPRTACHANSRQLSAAARSYATSALAHAEARSKP